MLRKLIHAATGSKTFFNSRPKFSTTTTNREEEGSPSSALRIIHAGGIVEQYYMAIPAARIIDKYYPAFTLTRPDIFRRPWDDVVVRPEEMLIPGQKYFVVPRRTVKKLKRRIDKRSEIMNSTAILFKSVEKMGNNTCQRENESSSFSSNKGKTNAGIMIKSRKKTRARNYRVRFFGIDTYKQDLGSSSSEYSINSADSIGKGQSRRNDARKRRTGNLIQWEPSLTSITENHDSDE